MTHDPRNPFPSGQRYDMTDHNPPPRRGMPAWGWVLLIVGGALLLSCCSCLGIFVYIGAKGPDIAVYAGNQVPQKFTDIIDDTGVLEPDEKILFFYSDAMIDITEGFYLVTDRKVVTYSSAVSPHETLVPYADIASADIYRDTSFFNDSQIELTLKDGSIVSFPVSSEFDRDVSVHEAIEQRITP